MATRSWLGTAITTAQVTGWTFGGTWETSDVITLTIGTKTVSTTATSTTISTIIDALVTTWNALDSTDYPEFAQMTASRSSNDFRLTSDVEGLPFKVTIATTETGGGAADAQTIDGGTSSTGVAVTANSGPNDVGVAANWSGATLPVDNDTVIFENSSVSALYNLDALASITPTSLIIRKTYTGYIGLPKWNATYGYAEYRQDYLQWDGATAAAIYANSGRIKLDFLTAVAAAIYIESPGRAVEVNLPAILLKAAQTSTLTIQKGDVGVAVFASETATIPTINTGSIASVGTDVKLWLGSGCTLTTINQGGGEITCDANLTTLNQTEGTFTNTGATTITTANLNKQGKYISKSTGTITTINARDKSSLDFTRDIRSRTVTTINVYSDNVSIDDLFKTVTWTNGIDNEGCGSDLSKKRLGTNFKLSIAAVS